MQAHSETGVPFFLRTFIFFINKCMFNPTKKFNIWWLLIAVHFAGILVAYHYEFYKLFWENDITYISSGIFIIWILVSTKIGLETYFKKISTDSNWFFADTCLSLGMIGTVIGFIFMLSTTFVHLDPNNIESMRTAITTMASGMSTALFTTLAGLIASLSIKLQLILQDY